MMYGERDDPYAVLARLGKRLEAAVVTDDILPNLVETIAITLKLPYVAIFLGSVGENTIAASYGTSTVGRRDEHLNLPLIYQGEPVGQLVMAPRAGAEPFSKDELKLLGDVSRQVGVAAHNVRLAKELQKSRARLVTAREEERRRLRRDLHDGLGPTLASQTLKLDAAMDLIDDDPAAARSLMLDIKDHSQQTVTRIRRLVYDLRPPALDDLGLIGALRAHISQLQSVSNGLVIDFIEPEENLPSLPAAIEVAAYRIIQEGLTNVVRHAHAQQCRIALSMLNQKGSQVIIRIDDDGVGLPQDLQPGVGIASMRERAAELGGSCTLERNNAGGTRIEAILPLDQD
jgi:signal transduction histidine kinase